MVLILGWAELARRFAPGGNTSLTRFDAIIVLGVPADSDGNPTPHQLSNVTEAVHEYERGVAPRLIVTGGAVANQFAEARVMARTARAQGVPESAIFVEPEARDTIQNACYSARIMQEHGWKSAEVITFRPHLNRAEMIFSHLPIEWAGHEAPLLQPDSGFGAGWRSGVEVLKTARYLVWAQFVEHCEP